MSTVNDSTNPVTPDLCQLVYLSHITSTGLASASTLNDIAEVAIERNQADNITGILLLRQWLLFSMCRRVRTSIDQSEKSLVGR